MVDTTPQHPGDRVLSYALRVYMIIMEWAVVQTSDEAHLI